MAGSSSDRKSMEVATLSMLLIDPVSNGEEAQSTETER